MNSSDSDTAYRDLPFADYAGRELCLDLYLPENVEPPLPTVMLIPVGGWRNSQRPEARPWLTKYGFAVAAIDCRVHPEVTAPATVFDCKAGIRWLRAKGTEYGVDPSRIGTWGGSAGGHLSALMAVTGDVAALEGNGGHAGVSTVIQAACDRCGPTDLERMADPQLAAANPVLREVTDNFVGGPVADHRDIARLVSPLHYVSADCPPILILHGDQDPTVPLAESTIFHQALTVAGVDSTLHVLPGEGHGWEESLTRDRIVEFFRRTLRAG
jgi:acetyl esterase/lipase